MATLIASVGDPKGGAANQMLDVLAVQSYLNNWILYGALKGRVPLLTSGTCDQALIQAIGTFQRIVLGFKAPDCRVDPNGATWKRLIGTVTTSPAVRTDHTPRAVLIKRMLAARMRGDKYVGSSETLRVLFDPDFDIFAARVAHSIRNLIVYRSDDGKFARALVRASDDLEAIHGAYAQMATPPEHIPLIAHLFRRRDREPTARWVMSIRFQAPKLQNFDFPPHDIEVDVQAKVMASILACASSAALDMPGRRGDVVFRMVNIADRVGYPKNKELWYYNPNPMRRFFSWRTDNAERAKMTSATHSELPFDGYAHPEEWRVYPFKTLASRYHYQSFPSCAPEIRKHLEVMYDQIEGSFADIQTQIDQTTQGGGNAYDGAPQLFLQHLKELRASPDHLYSAFPK